MKKLLLFATALMALTSVGANATELKQYVTPRFNYNFMKPEYKAEGGDTWNFKDQVVGGAIAYGLKVSDFRAEIEGFYNAKAKDTLNGFIDDGIGIIPISAPVEIKTKGLFLNGYWDIPADIKIPVKPYIGAGMGYAWKEAGFTAFGEKYTAKDKGLAWNVGLGASYEFKQNWNLDFGYRYEDLGDLKDDGDKTKIQNHKITLGLRYTF